MLRRDGYAAGFRRQLIARKLRLQQQRLHRNGLCEMPLWGTLLMAEPSRPRLSSIWPDLSRPVGRAEPIKRLPARDSSCRSPGKEAAKMNLSKPANPIRYYAFGSVITALILLSPVVAFLMVIAAEMLIDLLMVGGTSAVCVVAAGGIGLVLSRKFWRRPWVLRQLKPEPVPGKTAIAPAPM